MKEKEMYCEEMPSKLFIVNENISAILGSNGKNSLNLLFTWKVMYAQKRTKLLYNMPSKVILRTLS